MWKADRERSFQCPSTPDRTGPIMGEGSSLLAACLDTSWHHTSRMGGMSTLLELRRCAPDTASGKSARTSTTGTLSGPATKSFLRIIGTPAGQALRLWPRMNIRSASTRGPAAGM